MAAAHIKPPVEQIQEVVTVAAPEQIAVPLNIDEERERLRARQDAGIIHLLSTVYGSEGQPFKVNDFRLLADRHLLSYRIEAIPSGQWCPKITTGAHQMDPETNAQLSRKAKEILSTILYVTVATVDSDGQPWNTPVYAAHDEHYNFYWASWTESVHSRNIRYNPAVFLVVYDSTVPEGTGEGVYAKAKAYELADEQTIQTALRHYYGRAQKAPPPTSAFLGDSPRRIYKAVPQQFWMNAHRTIRGTQVDTRVKVDTRSAAS